MNKKIIIFVVAGLLLAAVTARAAQKCVTVIYPDGHKVKSCWEVSAGIYR
jgi:hypothetical protein